MVSLVTGPSDSRDLLLRLLRLRVEAMEIGLRTRSSENRGASIEDHREGPIDDREVHMER